MGEVEGRVHLWRMAGCSGRLGEVLWTVYERQTEDFTVEIQMDNYSQKVEFPPGRDPGGPQPLTLTDKEKKWIGHICR